MLQCVTMKLAVILSVLWLTQADTDYDRQPFGRQMCERLCENIRGCRVYMFTMVDFSCHVTNINVHNVSEENRKFLHMMPKLEKEYPFCQKCKKQSRIFMGKGGTVVYDEGRKGCAEGFTWIQGANVCFGAGLFTYYEAEQKCKETRVPGRLAVVDIVEEFERLRSFLRKQADMRCCWVGAERRNGSFEHWHDGTKIKTELWGKHEPNSGEETCGNLLDKYDFKLNDDSCNVFQCSYVTLASETWAGYCVIVQWMVVTAAKYSCKSLEQMLTFTTEDDIFQMIVESFHSLFKIICTHRNHHV